MEKKRNRAVIYCRVSTQEQVQKDALVVQVEEAKKTVEEEQWILVDQYIEIESGTTKHGRSEYMRLLRDMKDPKKFDIIVIKSLDRLNRSAKNWYLFVEELVSNDKLLYLYMDREFYSPDDNLIAGIKAILAEQYSRDLSRKLNNAHKYRQKNGTTLLLNNNTYGYQKNADKSVTIHPKEAEMIKKIYSLAAQGYGSRSISNILYQDGIRNRNGNQIGETTILRIIENPLYKGVAVMNKRHFDFEKKKEIQNPKSEWIYHKGLAPAIVDDELWEKANKMVKISAKKVKGGRQLKKRKELYNFSKKIICGECGATYYKTFRRAWSHPETGIIEWKCSEYLQHGRRSMDCRDQLRKVPGTDLKGCDNIHLRQENLIRAMKDLSGRLFSWQDEESLVRRIIHTLSEVLVSGDVHMKKEEMEKKLEAVHNRKERLLNLLLDEVISKQEYRRKKEELEEEEQQWEKRLEGLDIEEEKVQGAKHRILEIENKLREEGCEKLQIGLLMQALKCIIVYKDYLVVELNPAILLSLENQQSLLSLKIQKDTMEDLNNTLQDFSISIPTEPYFSDTRIIKRRKKEKVLQILKKEPYLTNRELSKRLDIAFSTAQYWTASYKKEGKLSVIMEKGRRKWIVHESDK